MNRFCGNVDEYHFEHDEFEEFEELMGHLLEGWLEGIWQNDLILSKDVLA